MKHTYDPLAYGTICFLISVSHQDPLGKTPSLRHTEPKASGGVSYSNIGFDRWLRYYFPGLYGLPPLSTPEGTPIGAVLGFCNILLKIQEDLAPSHWVSFSIRVSLLFGIQLSPLTKPIAVRPLMS